MQDYTLPPDRRYTASHLWVSRDGDTATIGLTELGESRHGKVLFVGLPAVGAPVRFGMPFGYLQSVAYGLTQLFPPVQGTVAEINDELWAHPDRINTDPLEAGWIVRITMSDPAELDELDDVDAYRQYLAGGRAPHSELPQRLLDTAQPVFLIDDRRRVLSCNGAAEQLIGLSRKEMRHGPLCRELFGCAHEEGGAIGKSDCPGLCSMLNLEPLTERYTVTNARGERTAVEATYTPVVEPGQPRRALVVLKPET